MPKGAVVRVNSCYLRWVPVSRRMPRRGPWLAALVGLVVVCSVVPAGAQQDPIQGSIDQALASLQSAQAAAQAASKQLEATRQRQAQLEAQLADVKARVADLAARIPALQAQVDQLRSTVRSRAAVLYRSAGPYAADANPLDLTTKGIRRKQLAEAIAKHDQETIVALNAAVDQLTAAKADLARQQDDLDAQQAALNQVAAQQASQQADLDAKVAAANVVLQQAQTLGLLQRQGDTVVMGPTVLTAPQMAAWYRSRGYTPHLQTSIDDLAQIYVDEGRAENVRGDLAFAQAIVETGGFSSAPDNNYAGMGWCDSCSYGTRFPTPRDGVRAQIQHLKNYADITSRASGLAHPPSPYWYGSDPARAIRNFDTFFAKGWAPTWNAMGHGNWATDPNYSGKVLNVYAAMVAFTRGS